MSASEGKLQPTNLHRVDLQPGDVIVAITEYHLTSAQRENFRADLQADFPGHKVVVIAAPGARIALWNECPAPALQVLLEGMRDIREKITELHRIVHEEDEPAETKSLDGDVVSRERDQTQSLG